jgi:hypothetical protein
MKLYSEVKKASNEEYREIWDEYYGKYFERNKTIDVEAFKKLMAKFPVVNEFSNQEAFNKHGNYKLTIGLYPYQSENDFFIFIMLREFDDGYVDVDMDDYESERRFDDLQSPQKMLE